LFHACHLAVTDLREIGAFGKVLPQQSVRVLIRATLPRGVRVMERTLLASEDVKFSESRLK
jgi:hypothetical protein